MAQLSFKIQAEWDKVQRLREEIAKLKQEIKGTDAIQNPAAFNKLNSKLQQTSNELKSVIDKIASADAKLMESANRIDKAVDTITIAQEKVSKATIHDNKSATKAQTVAIEGQAKAYADLKGEIDDILGTRELNIQNMLREQNAIRIVNAEISKINKSRQYGRGLTAKDLQRLQQLNDSLLNHKQALSEIRQELNSNAKLDFAVVGSMNELSQSLARMRSAYRALNEEERNSPFGQNLLKSIQDADAKIKELDASIGNHQRNVGNYQGAFNGLNMSVQQIVRELPSARNGINMFFLAISNNVPVMADQIKLTKEFNKEMKAAGKEPVPIWRQLVSSLLSWQTAMMVGITLLTIYGKDIANWVKSLFGAKNAVNDLIFAQRQLIDAQKEARKDAVSEQVKLKTLYAATQDANISMKDRLTAIKKMKEQYPSYFSNLSDEAILAGRAAGAYRQLTADILKAAQARAFEKKIEELALRKDDLELWNRVDEHWKNKKRDAYNSSVASHNVTDVSGARAFVSTGVDMSGGKRNGELEKEWSEREDRIKRHTEELNCIDRTINRLTAKVAKIKATEINFGNQKDGTLEQIDYDKLAREQSDAEREMEFKVSQSRIDAMQDSYEKEKAQRELNRKKELDEIEKERRDYLQGKINDAKKVFEADAKNKGKKFDASSILLTEKENGQFDERIANARKKFANEDKKEEEAKEDAMRNYLKQYGSYEERRLAIIQEYAKKIAQARSDSERLVLGKQEQAEYANLDLDQLKKSINWEYIFGNLDNVDAATAGAVKDQIEQFIDLSKELTPEQIKTLADAMNQLQDKMDLSEPLKSIKEARKEYAAAKTEYNKYKSDLDTANKKGDKAGQKKATDGMIKASQKMTKAKNKEERSFKEVTDIVQDYAKALQDAGNVIGGTAGECMGLAASALSAGASMAEGVDKFGKAVSNMEKAVAILAIIEAALQAIQTIMQVFGDSADATLTDYVSTMDTYIKLLDDDISSLNDSMNSAKNTMRETISYYEQLVALEKASATAVKSQSQVWLNSGASKGFLGVNSKASEGKKIVKQMKKDLSSGNAEVRMFYEKGYNSLNQFFRKVNGRLARSVEDFGRMDWIWKLSDEDLTVLSKDANAMALLGETLSSAVKEYADKTKSMTDKLNDEFSALLDVSYDDFYDGFTEMISSMDNDSQNFANNFAEYMRRALIKDMVASQYKSQLESLYKQAGKYAEDNTLDNHVDELREQYTRLAMSAQEQVRMIDSITGFTSDESQKATVNGISQISYEQANNIVALTTAGNISRDQIKNILTGKLSSIDVSIKGLQSLASERNSIVDELRTIQANSYIELQGIHDDTTSMNKAIKTMSEDMSDIKKEIKNM